MKAWLCRPMLEGDYIAVNVNEVFMVTRWQRYNILSWDMLNGAFIVAIVTGFMEI